MPMAALGGGGVVGDGTQLVNQDQLHSVMEARTLGIAKALPPSCGVSDIVETRAFDLLISGAWWRPGLGSILSLENRQLAP